jgi:hypothetical protein
MSTLLRTATAGLVILGLGYWVTAGIVGSPTGGSGDGYEPRIPGPPGLQPTRIVVLSGDWKPATSMQWSYTVTGVRRGSGSGDTFQGATSWRQEVGAPRGASASMTLTPTEPRRFNGVGHCQVTVDGKPWFTPARERTFVPDRRGGLTCTVPFIP